MQHKETCEAHVASVYLENRVVRLAPKDLQVLSSQRRYDADGEESFRSRGGCDRNVARDGGYVPVDTTPRLNYIYIVPSHHAVLRYRTRAST